MNQTRPKYTEIYHIINLTSNINFYLKLFSGCSGILVMGNFINLEFFLIEFVKLFEKNSFIIFITITVYLSF